MLLLLCCWFVLARRRRRRTRLFAPSDRIQAALLFYSFHFFHAAFSRHRLFFFAGTIHLAHAHTTVFWITVDSTGYNCGCCCCSSRYFRRSRRFESTTTITLAVTSTADVASGPTLCVCESSALQSCPRRALEFHVAIAVADALTVYRVPYWRRSSRSVARSRLLSVVRKE